MHLPIGASQATRVWRLVAAPLLALVLLVGAGCGGFGSPGPAHAPTPVPNTPGNGILYALVGTPAGSGSAVTSVYAFHQSDGSQVWSQQASGEVDGTARAGGTLYVNIAVPFSQIVGTLYAWDARTGATRWHRDFQNGLSAPLAATSDAVFVSAGNLNGPTTQAVMDLEALRASDGQLLWTADLGQQYFSGIGSATLGDGVLYVVALPVGSNTSILAAVDTNTGTVRWKIPLPVTEGVAEAAPILSDGVLYLAVQDTATGATSAVLAVRVSDGTVQWNRTTPLVSIFGGLSLAGATVCYSYRGNPSSGSGGGMVALRDADGSLSWRNNLQGTSPAVPIAADSSAVYAMDITTQFSHGALPELDSFDANTGKPLLSQHYLTLPLLVGGPGTFIQVTNDVVYGIGSNYSESEPTNGQPPPLTTLVFALNKHDGHVLWQQQVGGTSQVFLVGP